MSSSIPTSPVVSGSTFLRLTPDVFVMATLPTPFLCLAPERSPSYPRKQTARRLSTSSDDSSISNADHAIARRVSASAPGFKILKLGPVHWGEHLEEHQDDFHKNE